MKQVHITFALLLLAGCPPLKGYDGPDVSSFDLAIVKSNSTELSTSVNKRSVYDRGMALLPGRYDFSIDRKVRSERFNCRTRSKIDTRAMANCAEKVDKREAVNACPVEDFNETIESCDYRVRTFHCDQHLSLQANTTYRFDVDLHNDSVYFQIGSVKMAIPCSLMSDTIETTHESRPVPN